MTVLWSVPAVSNRAALALAAVLSAAPAVLGQQPALKSGLDLAGLDRSVRPQDDLFLHVNGGWLARTEIPADRVAYGAFVELADKVDLDVRAIIEELGRRPDRKAGTPAQQVADLYASLMNEARIEELGAVPIRAELERIDAIGTGRELAAEAGRLSSIGGGGPFGGSVAHDPRDPSRIVFRIGRAVLLLPDPGYYLKDDPNSVEIRTKYEEYLTRLFERVGRPSAAGDARAVIALETELARAEMTSRDASGDRKLTLGQLSAEAPGFDWQAWARPQGIDRVAYLILSPPSFFKAFAALVPNISLETWKAWLGARYVTASAPFLGSAFDNARFEFFGRVLTGQELPKTRWKRGVSLVNGYLGDVIGRLYAEKLFQARARARVGKLVAHLIEAFRQAVGDADWMSAAAKREAREKLRTLRTRIGVPDRWRDYHGLVIKADDLLGNVQRAQKFENDYRMARLVGPVNRGEWLVAAQSVNAYYSPAMNEIVFPAAILQPPFFDPDADDAVNYGAIGAVIGHEIAHALDERGRLVDGAGALRDWWRPEDEQGFRRRARVLAGQFSAMSPGPGLQVNGEKTLVENVGDLAGLEVAYRAYRLSLAGRPSSVIDGFTGEQRFFIGWARIWRAKMREENLQPWLLSSPHAPPQCRANGTVGNVKGFYEAFGVKAGDRLYIEPERRVHIW